MSAETLAYGLVGVGLVAFIWVSLAVQRWQRANDKRMAELLRTIEENR